MIVSARFVFRQHGIREIHSGQTHGRVESHPIGWVKAPAKAPRNSVSAGVLDQARVGTIQAISL